MQLEAAPPRTLTLPRLALSHRAVVLAATVFAGVVAFGVYLTTLAPTIMWYDMGEFATAASTLGIAHNTGYPLLILLGKLFTFLPAGDAAYRVNLMSAAFTGLAVAVAFGIIHDLTGDVVAAAVGALTLAFASTVWANATWATSYGLNLFFTALVTRLMLAWWRDRNDGALIGAALAFGLGMCNHRLIALVAPPSLLLLALGWRRLRRRTILLAAAAFVAGLSVYLYLPIRGEQEPALSWARPANWHTYWSMFLNGQTPSDYWRLDLSGRIGVLWEYPAYDLTWAGLLLAAAGFVVCARRERAVAAYFGVLVLLDAAIVETYSIHNVYNYLTPGYLALCVMLGVGAAWMTAAARSTALARANVRPWLRAAIVSALLVLLPASLLVRNHSRVDRSGDYSAADFAQVTLDRLPPRAVVLTDTWTASPLWYRQLVQGQRRDVLVSPIFSVPDEDVASFARSQMDAGRSVYVAEGLRTPLAQLASAFTVQPVLLGGIELMLTDSLPQPRYRDDLIAKGSLFRLLPTTPDSGVDAVPAGAERAVAFDRGLALVGFASGGNVVDRGSVVQLTYYWSATAPLDRDLSAATLFFDALGRTPNIEGFPAWSQTRTIGQGVRQTSVWRVGEIERESYFTLVPRAIPAGEYDVRISVFDPSSGEAAARAQAGKLVSIGRLTIR